MAKIIVGVDRSERSADAVAFARDLARVAQARLVLACAYPYSGAPGPVPAPEFKEFLHADAEDTLARLRDDLAGSDAVDTRAIADPSPARALHELAELERAALTVVGSSHRGRAGRVLLGSTAMRLLHGSPSAVAVVPEGHRERAGSSIERIGVAYNATEEARAALAAASATASALGASLRVVSVYDPVADVTPAVLAPTAYVEIRADAEAVVRRQVEDAVARVPDGVRVEPVLREGAADAVLAEESQHVDLMFTGSRGYGPRRAVLLGSVTHGLLESAACPVVVLPRGADEQAFEALFGQDAEAPGASV